MRLMSRSEVRRGGGWDAGNVNLFLFNCSE